MTLIEELFYQLEGVSTVRGDAATLALEETMVRVRALTPHDRHQLRTELHLLWLRADLDLADVDARRARLLESLQTWTERAATVTDSELQTSAADRLAEAHAALAAIEQERAEYLATIDRLEQVKALLAR